MQATELIVRTHIANLISSKDPASIDLAVSLTEGIGLSSLDLVILITSVFKGAMVPMTLLTEQDIKSIHTGNDLVQTLAAKQS